MNPVEDNLTKKEKEKAACITPDETGQFERVMFVAIYASFYFNKVIRKVFWSYQNEIAIVYSDDILLFAHSCLELLYKLRKVLNLLKQAALALKDPTPNTW